MSLPPIDTLVPHQGRMCLLEQVLSFDDAWVRCATRSHAWHDNPLRDDGGLRALHLCEYGAQAMAVHGGLLAWRDAAPPRAGMLVALRQVRLLVQRIDHLDGALEVVAERLLGSADSWQYAFSVHHDGVLLAQGRAAVVLGATLPQPAQNLDTPAPGASDDH